MIQTLKRIYSLVALSIFMVLGAKAYDVKVGDVYYLLNRDKQTALVTFLEDYSFDNATAYVGDIVVPETFEYEEVTYTVTGCMPYAFFLCDKLTSLTLPATVTTLAEGLCKNCTALRSVVISGPVTAIPDFCFQLCHALETIELPETLERIGTSAFYECRSLSEVHFSDNLQSIGQHGFAYCSSLTELHLPESLRTLSYFVFTDCYGLTEITLPDGLESMKEGVFENCTGIEVVHVGSQLLNLPHYTFNGCTSLTDVYCSRPSLTYAQGTTFKKAPIQHLYVPAGSPEIYASQESWAEFPHILPLKCSEPQVSVQDGNIVISTDTDLRYTSHTEIYTYSIEVPDVVEEETELPVELQGEVGELQLTYRVIAQARVDDTATESSDIAYATLFWRVDGEPQDFPTRIKQVSDTTAAAVLATSRDGRLHLSGLRPGEPITLYSLDGRVITRTTAVADAITLNAVPGQTVILRVGTQSVKLRVD